MTELQKNIKEISQKLGITFSCYPENSKPTNMPVCDKTFEDVTDDGSYTFFRFNFKGVGYIGVITGATQTERNYAALLPAYIESFNERARFRTESSRSSFICRSGTALRTDTPKTGYLPTAHALKRTSDLRYSTIRSSSPF